ncbi:MAG TPA: sialidase family protein [Bryobacteraceae bacterium]|nr:sialidase family protein [Bryobacteraceae bacterium]
MSLPVRCMARGPAVPLLFCAALAQAGPTREFIFESAPFRSCHASTIVELHNGDLLAAWFGGSGEGNPDVAIWASRRSNGAWLPPAEMAREPNIATYNPVLFYAADSVLWLYYKFGPNPERWSAARKFSRDEGATWSPVEHLPAGLYGPIRAKPYVARDGTIVSGTSVESYGSWACWIERSTDNGRTWQKSGPIVVPQAPATAAVKPGRSDGIIQPSVIPLGGGHLRLYARSTARIGKICVADSFDGGITWSEARPLDLPNPNSGIDAVALRDGRIVLVYNNSDHARTPLNLAVSKDGEHFRMFQTLEDEPGEFSYPALVQARDGDLLITYTWKRSRIRFARIPLADVPR